MPIYEYKCGQGHVEQWDLDVADRERPLTRLCSTCDRELHRVFGFRGGLVMHEHWNYSVGQPISSMRGFNDALKRANEANTARTGILHAAEAVVPSDLAPGE